MLIALRLTQRLWLSFLRRLSNRFNANFSAFVDLNNHLRSLESTAQIRESYLSLLNYIERRVAVWFLKTKSSFILINPISFSINSKQAIQSKLHRQPFMSSYNLSLKS